MPNDPKLILQTWIEGKGHVDLRSSNLTEAEATAVMSEIGSRKDEGEISFQDDQLLRVNLKESPGTAWLLPSKGADKDTPGRSARRLRILYSPTPNHPTEEVAEETLKAVEFPTTLPKSWIPFTPFAVQSTDEGDAERSSKWRPWRVVAGFVVAASLAAGAYYYFLGESPTLTPQSSERIEDSRNQVAGERIGSTGPDEAKEDEEWNKIKEELLALLNESWAMKIRDAEKSIYSEDDDDTILKAFAELFKRPDLGRVTVEREVLDKKLKDKVKADEMPFSAFLFRLPESIDDLGASDKLPATRKFKVILNNIQSEERFPELRSSNDESIKETLQRIQEELNFKRFIDRWNHGKNDDDRIPYWPSESNISGYKWIAQVCEILNERYGLPLRGSNN